jgi:hypothetical protein
MATEIINLVDTGLTIENCTFLWCKKMSDNSDVDTSGATLVERGNGLYILTVPSVTEDTDFWIAESNNPNQYAWGKLESPAAASQGSGLVIVEIQSGDSEVDETDIWTNENYINAKGISDMNIEAIAREDGSVELIGKQGATWSFLINLWQDRAKTIPTPLSGFSARGQIRRKYSSHNPAATFACSIPQDGQVRVTLSSTVTETLKRCDRPFMEENSYVYDIEIFDSSTPPIVTRIQQGILKINPEVTKE